VSAVFITEGEKKALALSQLGLAAVGIGGIWCGCKKGTAELIDDLAAIYWTDRAVLSQIILNRRTPVERCRGG